jgi:hypothetical protein
VSKSSSTKRCADFVLRLFFVGIPAMVACSCCEASRSLCVFAEGALKCNECVRKGRVCDGTFSREDFDRIEEEKRKLGAAQRAALERLQKEAAEVLSLERRLEALGKQQVKMIARESALLKEMDRSAGYLGDQEEPANVMPSFDLNDQQLALLSGSPASFSGGNL